MKTRFNLFFLLVIVMLSVCYDYPEVLLKRPQSVHNWRQCDGASLALSYYQNGMHFFKPQTQGLYSDNFTTGFAAPSEIPVLYYFVATLYSIFGYHEVIFRAVNLLLFFLGLFYLFKLGLEATQSLFYSLALVVLIFSAPLLVYYGNNYLPNTVALSFSLIGWYYFYRYYKSEKTGLFMQSMLFFGIAGAMKVTELTGPIIVLGMLLLDRFRLLKIRAGAHRHFIPKLAALAMIFATVTGWILYAKSYNNLHGSVQFSTFTFPYWDLDKEAVAFVFHKMRVLWFSDYFYPPTLYFLLAGLFLTAVLQKRTEKFFSLASLALLAAILGFSLLWFAALGDHDYFFIGFYVLPAFVGINMVLVLQRLQLKRVYYRMIQLAVVLFLVLNVVHAKARLGLRYNSWMNDYAEMKDLYTAGPYLRELGIRSGDTVVFYPSLNIRPLYLMNLRGWTMRDYTELKPGVHARDSLAMAGFIENGADYFIVNDTNTIRNRKSLLYYTDDLFAKYGTMQVFKLNEPHKSADTKAP